MAELMNNLTDQLRHGLGCALVSWRETNLGIRRLRFVEVTIKLPRDHSLHWLFPADEIQLCGNPEALAESWIRRANEEFEQHEAESRRELTGVPR